MKKSNLDPVEISIWLSSHFSSASNQDIVAGVNQDDCAVVKFGNKYLIATTDFINSKPIMVEHGIGGFFELGRLLVASNISDLCGSGAKPMSMLTACTVPKDTSRDDFEQLAGGIKHECTNLNIDVIGGDTKIGPTLALCGTAFGSASSLEQLFLKFNGIPGDSVWVSGPLGGTTAAVLELKNSGYDEADNSWVQQVLCEPSVPIYKSRELSKLQIANSGTDISDGLGMDLSQLCSLSNVGVRIDAKSIPIHKNAIAFARKHNMPEWYLAFAIGGDYQFIVSVPEEFENDMLRIGFTKIGVLTDAKDQILILDDQSVPLPAGGHNDMSKSSFADEVDNLITELRKL